MSATQHRRLKVDEDSLPVALAREEDLVVDAQVLQVVGGNAVPPFPAGAVGVAVGEIVDVVDAAEVGDKCWGGQLAFGCGGRRMGRGTSESRDGGAQLTILEAAGFVVGHVRLPTEIAVVGFVLVENFIHFVGELVEFGRVWREDSEWVIVFGAEVEDGDLLVCRGGGELAGLGVWDLGGGPFVDRSFKVRVGQQVQADEERGAEAEGEDDKGRCECPPVRD
jgi:hypothetical protein